MLLRPTAGPSSLRRALLSAGAGRLVALPVAAVFTFATTRLLIQEAGAADYALVALVLSLGAMLPFGDLGLGAAVINATSQSDDVATDQKLHRILLTSLRILCVVAALLLLAVLTLTLLEVWPALVGQPDNRNANWATGAVLALFSLTLPLSLGQRILIGMQRTGTVTLLQTIGSPAAFGLTCLALVANFGVVGLAVATPVGMLIAAGSQLWYAHGTSRIPLRPLLSELVRVRRYRGLSVRRAAGPMLVITIALPLALQTDRLILSHVTDITTVASYSLALQIYLAGWSVVSVCGLALWPIFARLRESGRAAGARSLRTAVLLFTATGLASGLVMTLLAPTAGGFLGGGEVGVSYPLSLAFGLLLLVQAVHLPIGMFMTSERGLRVQAVCVCFMVVVSCVLSIYLAGIWGARGPVFGSLVAVALCQLLPGALWSLRELRRAAPLVTPPSEVSGSRHVDHH